MRLGVVCEVLIPQHPAYFMDAQTHVHTGAEVCMVTEKKSVITERVLSLAVKSMQWPAWEPSPLCLNVKVKCLCSAQGETFRCCPPLNSCRKENKNEHIPSPMLAKPGDVL